MTPAGGRRGRRDNGLTAHSYAPIADVDPRVGEHLLEVLALAGIAAYLQPSADQHPVTRTTTLPSRPTDRLYVDWAHRTEARRYVDQLTREGITPEPETRDTEQDTADNTGKGTTDSGELTDLDAQWRRIIDQFDTPTSGTNPPWPAAEDVDDSSVTPTDFPRQEEDADDNRDVVSRVDRPTRWRAAPGWGDDRGRDEPTLLDALDSDFPPDDADSDEGYTPPPPPPLPKISRAAVVSIVAIVGGLALFLWPQLLSMFSTDAVQIFGVGGVVGGTAGLVWRLRSEPTDDTDPSDGAVV